MIRTRRGAGCRWCWPGLVAVAVLLRGRSFTDRSHATILAVAAVAVTIGVAGRYVLGLWTLPALLVGVSVIVAVPVAGLVAAVVVPIASTPRRSAKRWSGLNTCA